MKRNRVFGGLLYMMMLAVLGMGCGKTTQTGEVQNTYAGAVSMESTPIINYIVPQIYPNILINQEGYLVNGDKEAAVKGKQLPSLFHLVDSSTEQVVYSGTIEDITYNEEKNLYTGLAVFTDFAKEGTYYLECDKIGRSLPFVLQGQLYKQQFLEMYEAAIQACEEHTAAVSDIMALLTAYEWYPSVFPDEDLDTIPDVMEVIADWIAENEKVETDENHETLYVAALAKFSYLYQKFDLQYATECLQHASAVFSKMQAPLGKDADYFYALTELYRATGLHTYRNQIQDYASYFQGNSSYLVEPSYLYGAMTYLITRQQVDVQLCNTFMSDIMDRGEEVSNLYEDLINPIGAKNNGVDDLLNRAQELFCCNYVLNNYEYTHIIEEFLDYLMGRNLESVCFYPEEGVKSGYLLLLSQLAATVE